MPFLVMPCNRMSNIFRGYLLNTIPILLQPTCSPVYEVVFYVLKKECKSEGVITQSVACLLLAIM